MSGLVKLKLKSPKFTIRNQIGDSMYHNRESKNYQVLDLAPKGFLT